MTNQQLKAHCEDVIANPQDHLDWVVDMARVALASLEATPGIFEWRFKSEPVSAWVTLPIEKLQQAKDTFGDMVEYRFWCSAPPVPELKPVELPPRQEPSFGADSDFSDGFNYCIEEVKRLNAPHTAPIEPICATGRKMPPHEFSQMVNELRDVDNTQSRRAKIVGVLHAFNIRPRRPE